ncbi:hypothetical protein [Novipirellula artificiosorum]|uniref:Uncharacterized protein n=1 Tax=Novipirellula artificiosorum TaxID=2528016 RepID=A0A5C6DEI4_9BACT|nr:hypothetical protein [Novipirellula artificiosorum]TWU34227.1 hypothetical protein Poly41_43730 [Novipirellula artificiosorum]
MPKFYVQCGPVETIVDADSPCSAAMNALDGVLQSHLWIYDDNGLTPQDCRMHLMLEALLHFAPSVRVSEQGFHRDDAIQIGTPETIDRWHRLMVGMRRLFVAAGLATRPMASTASSQDASFSPPRVPR